MIAKGIFLALFAGTWAQGPIEEDGLWDVWTEWANCTAECGPGTQNRTRECVDETGSGEDELLENEGIQLNCVGGDANSTETQACDLGPCAMWGLWGSWGSCSVTCAGGNQTRSRDCMEDTIVVTDPQTIADYCPGPAVELQSCNDKKCPKWAEWGAWGACDAECNGGTRERVRDCTDAAKHRTYFQTMMLKLMGREDLICDGIDTQSEACNIQSCNSPCGDINTATFYNVLGVGVKSTVQCKSNSNCELACIDAGQVPVEGAAQTLWDGIIPCVGTTWTLDAAKQNFQCQDLACNFITDFATNVTLDSSVGEVCAANDCPLNCTNPTYFPQPAATINCANWGTHAAYLLHNGASCTQSQCGKVNTVFWMTSQIETDFDFSCDATVCNTTCSFAEQVPSLSNKLWDGIIDCVDDSGDMLWDGTDIINVGCQFLSCDSGFHPASITTNQGASILCGGDSCAVSCPNNLYPSPAAIDCNNIGVTTVGCNDLSCGDINDILDTYNLDSDISLNGCAANKCTLVCDTSGVPFPSDTVTCDDPSTSNPASGSTIKCAETTCGDPADFTYGSGWSDVTATCTDVASQAASCSLTCASGFPYPVDTVACNAGVLTPATDSEILCADTPCGPLADTYTIQNVESACDTNGCNFTCTDPAQMPSYFSIPCSGTTYQHVHDSDSNSIFCTQKIATPCGNPSPTFTYDANEVDIVCAPFESIYQNTPSTCAVSCKDNTKNLVGDATLTCAGPLGSSFTNANKQLSCKDTTCGDLSDKWTIANGVNYTCDVNGVCTMGCTTPGHVPNVASVQCTNSAFVDVTLFNGQLTNPEIKCKAPADTYCGDTSFFTDVPADTTFLCNQDTQVCDIICDKGVYGNEVQASPATVTCNVQTEQFKEAADLAIECQLFDVTCGNLEDQYTIDPAINTQCIKFGGRRANFDRCTLKCNDTSLYPTVTDEITCNVDTAAWVTPNDQPIKCAETKCGDPDNWSFGAEFAAMTKTCDMQANDIMPCILSCTLGSNPGFVLDGSGAPRVDITCNSDRTLLPASGSMTLQCADTPCGKLTANAQIVDNGLVSTCTASGCDFSCTDNTTMPSYKTLGCTGSTYDHADGSNSNPITCVPIQDTPCGNLAASFSYNPVDIDVNCSDFNSIHQTAAHECSPFCKDPTKVLVTDATITCANSAFTNTDLEIMCKETACGDVSKKFTLAAGVSHSCDKNTGACSMTCDVNGESPNIASVQCNAQTSTFDDVVLFPGTSFAVTNPTIECAVLEDTVCGNAAEFTSQGTGIELACDWAATKCDVTCNENLVAKHSQPNIETLTCDPGTKQFDQAFDVALECNKYDVTCGMIEDHFDVKPGVNYSCSYYESRSLKADKCIVSCNTPTFVPRTDDSTFTHNFGDPFEVICNQETKAWIQPKPNSMIECVPPPETACGYIDQSGYTIDDTSGSMSCDGSTCFFTCNDPTHHSPLSIVTCQNGKYVPNSANVKVFKCTGDYDTGCGNSPVTGNTAKSCANNVCTYTCASPKFHYGVTEATCTVANGTSSWGYATILHTGPNAPQGTTESICGDTMCGDLTGIRGGANNSLGIQDDVIINSTILEATGYGSILLECDTPGQVVSGLRGQSAVACTVDGVFDLVDPNADITCSDTTCGDVADALAFDTNVMPTCKNDVCSFKCNVDGVDAVEPSVTQLICQTQTGLFLTGSNKEVTCVVGCDEFGPSTGFVLDELIHQECDDAGENCDVICRKRNSRGVPVTPTIKETGQPITKLVCEKLGDASEGVWKAVVHSIYGVPIHQTINGEGVRHLVCDEDTVIVEEDKNECKPIREAYNINEKNMMIRCTQDACLFLCSAGFELTKGAPAMTICKLRHSDMWTPPYGKEIACNKIGVEPTDEPDDEEEEEDSCDPIDVKMEDTVSQSCGGNKCTYTCSNGGNPSIEVISCVNGKWQIPKDVKKKGVKCAGGDEDEDEEEGCGEFTAFGDGVVADCSAKSCSFSCADGDQQPNASKAKCVTKKGKSKWDLGKKGPKKVECGGAGEGGDDEDVKGCGQPAFDDTVVADCDDQSCTFTCVDESLTPNSLTATCGKKNKWSFDDKKITSVTCASGGGDGGDGDDGNDGKPPHKCDMAAFDGVIISDCSNAKVSTCTATCVDETLTPDVASVDCKKGKWTTNTIVCSANVNTSV